MPVAKWPDLEAEVNNWITHRKNNRLSVFTKMIIFKMRLCAVGGTDLWTFCMPVAKWPDLEAEMNNWITHHKNNRFSVFTKMIIFKMRLCAFGGTNLRTVRTAKRETLVLKIL